MSSCFEKVPTLAGFLFPELKKTADKYRMIFELDLPFLTSLLLLDFPDNLELHIKNTSREKFTLLRSDCFLFTLLMLCPNLLRFLVAPAAEKEKNSRSMNAWRTVYVLWLLTLLPSINKWGFYLWRSRQVLERWELLFFVFVAVVVVGKAGLSCLTLVESVVSFSHPNFSSGWDPLPPFKISL